MSAKRMQEVDNTYTILHIALRLVFFHDLENNDHPRYHDK